MSYSEGQPLATESISPASEPFVGRYESGSGYGVAAFQIPALPGFYSVYLVNEEGERLKHLQTRAVRKQAEAVVAEADILALAAQFEKE